MLALLFTAVAASLTPPSEPIRGKIQSSIWADLQLNAMIGNGNWLASLWYNAGSDTASDLHIRELACSQRRAVQRCSFELHRDGGAKKVMGELAPEALVCAADFNRTDDGWAVSHRAAHKVGHSQTSMRCTTLKQ